MTTRRRLLLPVALVLILDAASAAPAAPAPRELTTDRPDATESPFTVDAGRVQLEMDVAAFTRNRLDGVRTTEWVVTPFNVRYGLTRNLEAGVFITPHVQATERVRGGVKTTLRGLGDTTLRGKYNFQGNDGGGTAFGLIADLKLPTAAEGLGNDKVEGALTFPVAFEVGAGWEGAAMTSLGVNHLGPRGYRPVWSNTITFARELAPDLGGFLEFTSSAGDGRHVATFNCGLTRAMGPGVQLDLGAYIGLSRTAPDLTVFAGFSRKF
ncbi:MAG: transporter [Opitutaceae bacterium]|nr:transporter [Opitutaceae bacterium]